MKIAILTTDTKHHTYFINEISKIASEVFVIYETKQLVKSYITGPFFVEEQDKFEEKFFKNYPQELSEEVRSNIKIYDSCNNSKCVSYLQKLQPDIIITFGTGLIKPEAYSTSKICSLNIHRGHISEYRGLDSDLWALYNKEFDKIGVAIHHLNEKLDTGDVLKQEIIKTVNKFEVYQIRYLTTVLATRMIKEILSSIKSAGRVPESKPQKKLGKYYSAMPLDKKIKAKENLDTYFKEKKAAIILLYHGVTSSESEGIENFSCKHIHVDKFKAQMNHIKNNLKPVSLREMARILSEENEIPEGLVAVTFDDSFKNIHDVALPILEDASVPATFFVTTGMVETSRRYWVDQLEHTINHAKNKKIQIKLGELKEYHISSNEEKIECIMEIKKFLKASPSHARKRILEDIEKEAHPNTELVADNYQNLSWGDVQRLDQSPLCEVGGHTVNHEILSYLNDENLDYEITRCLADLEVNLGHKVDLFSYPEGQAEHYNQKVVDKLKERGINICPSAIDGVNYLGESVFNLKRIMVDFMGTDFPYSGYKNV